MPKIPVWQLVFVNARLFFVGSDDVPAEAKIEAALGSAVQDFIQEAHFLELRGLLGSELDFARSAFARSA